MLGTSARSGVRLGAVFTTRSAIPPSPALNLPLLRLSSWERRRPAGLFPRAQRHTSWERTRSDKTGPHTVLPQNTDDD
jgi:hypothetical protein